MAELYLVEFKGSRKEFYYNTFHHSLAAEDYVITQAEQGEDIGWINCLVEDEDYPGDDIRPRSILRPAGGEDMKRYHQLKENETRYRGEIIQLVARHGLPMKIVDVECQFDGNKITFYFTADHRVDFRALVRDLASRYRTRIELRQIGVRDEARRIGGFGICGLKQCCNSFIRDFVPISTQHARAQDLPLNPSKISGNCGRLLCCLRYEFDLYKQAHEAFPSPGATVKTEKGEGRVDRIDVFNEEAVVSAIDGTSFRVAAREILEVVDTRKGDQKAAKSQDTEEGDEESLADLEDPVNGSGQ